MLKCSFVLSVGVIAMGCAGGEPEQRAATGDPGDIAPSADGEAPPQRTAGWASLDLVPYVPPKAARSSSRPTRSRPPGRSSAPTTGSW
jgi:hypothetical protein